MMHRDESVTYSSLPQDEGVTPRSSFVTSSRPGPNPHNRRDVQLTAILVTVVIVTGLTLAATLPLVLKSKTSKDLVGEPADQSNGNDMEDGKGDLFISPFHEKGDKNDTLEDYDHTNKELGGDQEGNMTSASNKEEASMHAINFTATKSPIQPETAAATVKITLLPKVNETTPAFVVSGDSVEEDHVAMGEGASETSLSESMKPIKENMTVVGNGEGMDSMTSGEEEEGSWGGGEDSEDPEVGGYQPVTEDGEGSLTSAKSEIDQIPPTQEPDDEKYEIDMNQLLDEIYGEQGSAKPVAIEDNDSWTTDILSTQDKVTMVILAAVVAVALAAVIMAVGWLVYARVAARRRRINIQSVITDLQSRDKIVLLNSEESEEE